MKIKLSKSQWEKIGKEAGWKNPELTKLPPMGEMTKENTSGDDSLNPLVKEQEVQHNEALRLFQQLLKSINHSVVILAKRYYGDGVTNVEKEYVDDIRDGILQVIAEECQNVISGYETRNKK